MKDTIVWTKETGYINRNRNSSYFQAKETRLKNAVEKVKNKLSFFAAESEKINHLWTEKEHEFFKDWNLLHDLQYRLEDRLWDNYSNFKEWHWDNFGFNTYP